ncbi:hypothetical protein DFJ58DRAFT_663466 [Suillus subalutaceus]|uniref:uncharacterized protein n=1 Tax=Suillus subalutaceus TaxID=48586 RepID=UPI001B8610B1|nr:uncharacterized protein DFJ58DRAFT_663466 [Suillus subalutaceus]KAG1847168.1 hypothetical protein DFJ58DRAFT_663466 [Suillus subalutaceus]
MSSWIGDVCAHAHHLKCVEITLPDIFTIVVLTSGLPPEYEPVVVALDAVDSAKLTLDVAIARLLNEEERHISQQLMAEYRSSATAPEGMESAAYAARTPNVTCFDCGNKGHYVKDCKKRTLENVGAKVAVTNGPDLSDELEDVCRHMHGYG